MNTFRRVITSGNGLTVATTKRLDRRTRALMTTAVLAGLTLVLSVGLAPTAAAQQTKAKSSLDYKATLIWQNPSK